MKGAPEPYFAMYIVNVIDALDEEHSHLSEPISYLGDKRSIYIEEFVDEKISGALLFRLPGWKYAPERTHDYATQEFIDLVKKLEITGFEFWRHLTVNDVPIIT